MVSCGPCLFASRLLGTVCTSCVASTGAVGFVVSEQLGRRMGMKRDRGKVAPTEFPLLCLSLRCHPAISEVPNRHFYNGALLDGCCPVDRPPLLPGLPPVTCVDVVGQEQRSSDSSSVCNHQEARRPPAYHSPCHSHP